MTKEIDYIVVGLGIAGISFCEQLRRKGKSFIVYSDAKFGATANSGGILNPTILKFFTAVKDASRFYPEAVLFYNQLPINSKEYIKEIPVNRIFSNIQEQNNWIVATDKIRTKEYFSHKIFKNINPSVIAPLGYGEVMGVLQIDSENLLKDYQEFLLSNKQLNASRFIYNKVLLKENRIQYRGWQAKNLIFCDGMAAVKNPFFPKGKIMGNMGEYLIIKAPDLKCNKILKGSFYIIPLGNDQYKVGATFNQNVLKAKFTKAGKDEITNAITQMINCDFEIIGRTSGVRATTKDRNALIGRSSKHPQISFINGLGSRGFLLSPLLSELLYQNLEENKPIPPEIDINRKI